MIIGIVKEIKKDEYRVGAPPMAVSSLIQNGHNVLVESSAGASSGFTDSDYSNAGGVIVQTAAEVWEQAEMIYHSMK